MTRKKSTSKKSKTKGAAKSKTKKTASPKRKKQQRRWFGFIVKWLFVLGLWAGIFTIGIVAYFAKDLPDITQKATFERKTTIIIKDQTGNVAARYGDIIGNRVSVNDLPPHLIQAVLATEDRRFYNHFGIDPIGLSRAMMVNIRSRRLVQGGSTITQQLAKNLFLTHARTYKRKIQEALLAIWLEQELTKDEILSAYLNRVYLGSGSYGVDAASELYFNRPVQEISLRQAATLAGLLKAPSRYSPLVNPSLSKQRTDTVLQAMVSAGYITQAQANGNSKLPPKPLTKPSKELVSRFYTDWIIDEMNDLIGAPTEDIIIETTLNTKIQNSAAAAIERIISAHGKEKKISQGAAIFMRPSGEVIALIGGHNYNRSQFNRAVQSLRPPGSAFKPILYLTAIERGWEPYDTIIDEPITNGSYRPKNFANKYYGEVTLSEALTKSMNTAAVRLMQDVKPSRVIKTAKKLGITSKLEPDLSLALGSSGVSLIEMTNAYAMLANSGLKVRPYGITKITSMDDGEIYYERPPSSGYQRTFNLRDISDVTRMLNGVIEYGTGKGAAFKSGLAGKTGTSNDSRDALFIGYDDTLIGSVWLGNDDNSPMKKVTGGSYPAQIWKEVMIKAQSQYSTFDELRIESNNNGLSNLLERVIFGTNTPAKSDTRPITQERYEQRYNE